jgi:uncharacterized RDD family membrane protein YckC
MPPDDKLIIETPEQTVLEFPLAGIGSRSLAVAIDTFLQAGAGILLAIVGGLIALGGIFPQVGKQWGYAILIFLGFLVQFGYFAFFEAVWNGQTPGKRWAHLRVIQDSGRPIAAQEAILRNLLRIVDSLPLFYGTGIITSLISPQNKRLGDYLAGTVVVREDPLQKGQLAWEPAPAPLVTAAQPVTLTAAEFQLVEAFLERRRSLEPHVRLQMARQVADTLGQRCSIPHEARKDSEKFLEALAAQYRSKTRFG